MSTPVCDHEDCQASPTHILMREGLVVTKLCLDHYSRGSIRMDEVCQRCGMKPAEYVHKDKLQSSLCGECYGKLDQRNSGWERLPTASEETEPKAKDVRERELRVWDVVTFQAMVVSLDTNPDRCSGTFQILALGGGDKKTARFVCDPEHSTFMRRANEGCVPNTIEPSGDGKHIECFIEDCNLNSEYLWGDKGVCAKHWHLRSPIGADIKWEPRVKCCCGEHPSQCVCKTYGIDDADETCMRCGKQVKETEAYAVQPVDVCRSCVVFMAENNVGPRFVPDPPSKPTKFHSCNYCDNPVTVRHKTMGDLYCFNCSRGLSNLEDFTPASVQRPPKPDRPVDEDCSPGLGEQRRCVIRLEQMDNGWLMRVNRKVSSGYTDEAYNVRTLRMEGLDDCLEHVLLEFGIPLDGVKDTLTSELASSPFDDALAEHLRNIPHARPDIARDGFAEGWHSERSLEEHVALAGPEECAREYPDKFAFSFKAGKEKRASHG